jgi:protein tyrosine/serine phosphatase
MPRYLNYVFGIGIAVLIVGGPICYATIQQSNVRNLHVVRDGVLYRSGQMSLAGLERVIHDFGIKTVVSLRDAMYAGNPPPDLKEEVYCRQQELNYVRISPRQWWAPDGSVPAEQGVETFRKVMSDPANYPVLIHCFAGVHRTGAYCAIFRMEHDHWTNSQAIDEMKTYGYINLDDEWDILGYLEQYEPTWKKKAPATGPPPK